MLWQVTTPTTTPQMTPLHWLTLGLVAVSFLVIWPLWPPLVLAAWTAALTRPLLLKLERVLKGRSRAAAVLSLMIFVILALPLVLMTLAVLSGAQDMVKTFQSGETSPFTTLLSSSGENAIKMPANLSEAVALLERTGAQGMGVLSNVFGVAAKGVIGLFIFFAGAYTFLIDSQRIWKWLMAHAPFRPSHLERIGKAFHETGRGLLVGVGLTTLSQAVVATIAYLALGVPRAFVLGPITGIASVIPVVGTGLVWGPISLGFFLTGDTTRGIILIVIGVVIIGAIDNLLRPVFAKYGSVQMPMFLLFLSVFGGLAAFGTWGALMGPLAVRLAMEVLAILNHESVAESVKPDANELPLHEAAESRSP